MEDKIFDKLLHSKCEKDAKSRHFWEKLGIGEGSDANLIWRCSQCQKCIIEPLEFLELDENDFRLSNEQEKGNRVITHFMKSAKNLNNLSRKKLHTMLFQTYFIGLEEGKKNI